MQSHTPGSEGGFPDRPFESQELGKVGPLATLRKLLLVDDETDGAEFAAILLRLSGLPVVVVHSATDALQVLESDGEIDAVLSDIFMPDMTGLQLADAVRARYPTIKIILMSGYALPELLNNAKCNYLFVEKPYKIEALLKILGS